jgi:hypothetical protein
LLLSATAPSRRGEDRWCLLSWHLTWVGSVAADLV